MFSKLKRLAIRKKGMEALQAVLLLGAAFFIINAIKSLAGKASEGAEGKFGEVFTSK